MRKMKKNLPEDLIIEILLRLPVKSLVRFRCVSKQWFSLISDPRFAKSHFKQTSDDNQRLLLSTPLRLSSLEIDEPFEDGSSVRQLVVPFKREIGELKIFGSCNGLVCVGIYEYKNFYIWNPSTGEHRKLPDPGAPPHGETYNHGFGYDASTDDYKLLVVTSLSTVYGTQFEVFSLKRNSWKRVQGIANPDDVAFEWYTSPGILFNGALHWVVECSDGGLIIHAFDLAGEKFYNVPTPPRAESVGFHTLRNIGGHLCLICDTHTHVVLWGMMEYGVQESWAPMFTVVSLRHINLQYGDLTPQCLSKCGQLLSIVQERELIKSNGQGEILEGLVVREEILYGCEGTVFVESLLSPNDYDADDGEPQWKTRVSLMKTEEVGMRKMKKNLLEDLIIEILLRLPVKSLVRFRCVSKQWFSLISDPRFAKSHFKQTSDYNQRLLLSTPLRLSSLEIDEPFEDGSSVRQLVVPFKREIGELKIFGSCNGLVCVGIYEYKNFYIWNPSTGEHRKLPDPGTSSPHGETYNHGFGYDASTDDYKLLVATSLSTVYETQYEVFSLKRNSWKRVQGITNPDDVAFEWYTSPGILFNGALHWVVECSDGGLIIIHAFDLAGEKFYDVPMPPRAEFIGFHTLRNIGGRLCLICDTHTHVVLWGMMEYGVQESWAPMFTVVSLRDINLQYGDLTPQCLPKCGQLLSIVQERELIKSNGQGEILEGLVVREEILYGCEGIVFVESLLSPNDYDADDGETHSQ